ERLFAELGVPVPPAVMQVSQQLPAQRAVLSIFEIPYCAFDLSEPQDPASKLDTLETMLVESLRRRASDFLGIAETQMLLDQLEQFAPPLSRQVVPKPISLTILADVLRRLVEEAISVRDLRSILEALALAPATDKDPLSLAEFVRGHLRRALTFQLTAGVTSLPAYLLDPEVEETIRNAVQRTPSGNFLALSPNVARQIVSALLQMINDSPPPEGRPVVLLTQPDVRRFVRKLVETSIPQMHVVSYAELMPEIALQPLGRTTTSAAPA
ncbi:MAG TPA: FHIPEP family type III secretion protein, partial [Polyangiaceae bacterium]|nr:FHIPEP family type III secretion protein [Polyangiaceae bacterium]